jgi:GNAT superfamily N-acetyltransferase
MTAPAIIINAENLNRYGFSCFTATADDFPDTGDWRRRLIITRSPGVERTQDFVIPRRFFIRPEQYQDPLVESPVFKIVNNADPGVIQLLSERAGWNQTGSDLQHLVNTPEDSYLAVFNHKGVDVQLGTGVALELSEQLSWIAMVVVHEEFRRHGIASAILLRCLQNTYESRPGSIIGLDATPQLRQIYRNLGFQDLFVIWRSIVNAAAVPKSGGVGNAEPLCDVAECVVYETERNGSERHRLLSWLCRSYPGGCFCVRKHGRISGYVMSRPGRLKPFVGPLVADTADVALGLIQKVTEHWLQKGFQELFVDVPLNHFTGFEEIVRQQGSNGLLVPEKHTIIPDMKPCRAFVRMYQKIKSADSFVTAGGKQAIKQQWADIVSACVANYAEVSQREKRETDFCRFMYGTAGPEFG